MPTRPVTAPEPVPCRWYEPHSNPLERYGCLKRQSREHTPLNIHLTAPYSIFSNLEHEEVRKGAPSWNETGDREPRSAWSTNPAQPASPPMRSGLLQLNSAVSNEERTYPHTLGLSEVLYLMQCPMAADWVLA